MLPQLLYESPNSKIRKISMISIQNSLSYPKSINDKKLMLNGSMRKTNQVLTIHQPPKPKPIQNNPNTLTRHRTQSSIPIKCTLVSSFEISSTFQSKNKDEQKRASVAKRRREYRNSMIQNQKKKQLYILLRKLIIKRHNTYRNVYFRQWSNKMRILIRKVVRFKAILFERMTKTVFNYFMTKLERIQSKRAFNYIDLYGRNNDDIKISLGIQTFPRLNLLRNKPIVNKGNLKKNYKLKVDNEMVIEFKGKSISDNQADNKPKPFFKRLIHIKVRHCSWAMISKLVITPNKIQSFSPKKEITKVIVLNNINTIKKNNNAKSSVNKPISQISFIQKQNHVFKQQIFFLCICNHIKNAIKKYVLNKLKQYALNKITHRKESNPNNNGLSMSINNTIQDEMDSLDHIRIDILKDCLDTNKIQYFNNNNKR